MNTIKEGIFFRGTPKLDIFIVHAHQVLYPEENLYFYCKLYEKKFLIV